MPGSLLGVNSKVRRSNSTRSDRSDVSSDSRTSAKKVSFNKSVRVKKYPRRTETYVNGDIYNEKLIPNDVSPEKKFWFKVYKNLHNEEPNIEQIRRDFHHSKASHDNLRNGFGKGKLKPIVESSNSPTGTLERRRVSVGTSTNPIHNSGTVQKDATHNSKFNSRLPQVKQNHVKNIVEKFNKEALLRFEKKNDQSGRSADSEMKHSPIVKETVKMPSHQMDNNEEPLEETTPTKNKIINGVKVIFGMTRLKKNDDENLVDTKNKENTKQNARNNYIRNSEVSSDPKGPFTTNVHITNENSEDRPRGRIRRNSSPTRKSLDRRASHSHPKPVDNEVNNNMKGAKSADILRDPSLTSLDTELWETGEKLTLDNKRFETSLTKYPSGRLFKTLEEGEKVWENQRIRRIYEDQQLYLNSRRAKSYDDLSCIIEKEMPAIKHHQKQQDKDRSLDSLVRQKPSKPVKKIMKDKGVQCSKTCLSENYGGTFENDDQLRVFRSKGGFVSAYSNVPILEEQQSAAKQHRRNQMDTNYVNNDMIFKQVQKEKAQKSKGKKKNNLSEKFRSESSLYDIPSSRLYANSTLPSEESSRKVKTKSSSFGFKLKTGFDVENEYETFHEKTMKFRPKDINSKNWYDLDSELHQKSFGGSLYDTNDDKESDFSSEASNLYRENIAAPSSVIREINPQKQEISYENVPYEDSGRIKNVSVSGGLWSRMAEEDYRREMAQSDVSYPSGGHVGHENSITLTRNEKKDSANKRAFTVDKQIPKEKENQTGEVRILVNGKDIEDVGSFSKGRFHATDSHVKSSHSDQHVPTSVQSDPLYVRGGLAAAYQTRQKARVRRSNSSVTRPNSKERKNRHHGNITGSSAASGVSSSDSDSTRHHKPLVMYIPGVSHYEKRANENEQRNSVAHVFRSRSMLSPKPGKYQRRGHNKNKQHPDDSSDVISEEADTLSPLKSPSKNRKSKTTDGAKSRTDIQRRNSMPKDTKFNWFKWKVKVKPSREVM
ncbi:uncharacterized protein LOC143237177 [Tachypleus tridentatus]|uniref:uncharacterized protein LOC143237177 n=1 Tax=Tachypleus tridentatus TaxID=6853 RepID=UPI003FD3FB20